MGRGLKAKVGDTRWSPNGYHYTRTELGWALTHRILAEKKLGRPLAKDERVRFKDGDRKNIKVNNIEVFKVAKGKTGRKRAQLQARIDELQAQLAELEREEAVP